ncbi:hypothetical protein AHAS_Ahas20G0189000 [Arachis hypogaea]
MVYHPPSPIDYSNDGWEYHQENTNSKHSNQRRYAPEPQINQANHMRYCLEPQMIYIIILVVSVHINKSVNNQVKGISSQSHKVNHTVMILTLTMAGKGILVLHMILSKRHHLLIMLSINLCKIFHQCHKMIHTVMNSTILQVVLGRIKIRKHPMCHTPLIKSHHHLSRPLIHLCKIIHPHFPFFHLKILHHLIMPQHKVSSKIHTMHSTNHKIHPTPLNTTSPQHIHVTKITLNLHLLN